MDKMREFPCPTNNEECKYAPDCHSSIHHVYPRRTVETLLQKRYSEDPRNKIRACRNIHDLLDSLPPPPFPAEEVMNRFLGAKAIEASDE